MDINVPGRQSVLDEEWTDEQAQREAERRAAKRLLDESQGALGRFDSALSGARGAIRSQAANGIAAALSQAPVGSGASLAAGRQGGLEAGNAIAGFDVSAERDRVGLQQAAAAMAREGFAMQNEAGNLNADRRTKIAGYQDDIAREEDQQTGWLGTNEAGVRSYIEDMILTEEDPEVRAWLQAQAERYPVA